MNTFGSRLKIIFKAIFQLGWKLVFQYAWYQGLLRLGLFRLLTPKINYTKPNITVKPLSFELPTKKKLSKILGENSQSLIAQANEILSGQYRPFSGPPHPISFKPHAPYHHWSKHKAVWIDDQDIKFTWELGRFGWGIVLARAYHISQEERFAEGFWRFTEAFIEHNPPNMGPHWSSGQEVALRLIALSYCYTLFKDSPHTTEERTQALTGVLIAHAKRIPPTLSYARAQNNNHLLTEAAGLYTAAAILPDHPDANRWYKLGWKWFNKAIQNQITEDGTYVQHSTNYHRLMLQTALWTALITTIHKDTFPKSTSSRLGLATQWLQDLSDEVTGQVPNLGPNDGAYILPLTTCLFEDYRPVLQAAGKAFLAKKPFPNGSWDEMTAWLAPVTTTAILSNQMPRILRLNGENSWAALRAVKFNSRPGHADQLHLDLWWRGINIAQDAGTYFYNAPPPWQNAFSGTDVHNTATVNETHQMTAAGRFLWVDWAQAETLNRSPSRISAQHFGYKHFGITHTRTVDLMLPDTYIITDSITSYQDIQTDVRVHWLLPDWLWELDNARLRLHSPRGTMAVRIESEHPLTASLARGGEAIKGKSDAQPHRGWVSPTYGQKIPAISFAVMTHAPLPVTITSRFIFPV